MYTRPSGLGLAPAVVAAALPLAGKIIGGLFGPSENEQLQREAQAGNVVAWWRLKVRAGERLPAGIPPLSELERDALAATMGPASVVPPDGYMVKLTAAAKLRELQEDGTAAWLAAKSAEFLAPAAPAEPAIAGVPTKWIVAGAVGLVLVALFRR